MSMADEPGVDTGKPLTGRKVLFITVGAFAIIFGVNIFMAYSAIGTFPGLEVDNSYVASQEFDRNRAAQEALGWDVSATLEGDSLRMEITGDDGALVRPARIDATLGRSTQKADDITLEFVRGDTGAYIAETGTLNTGYWVLWLNAIAQDGTPFKQRIELYVPRG